MSTSQEKKLPSNRTYTVDDIAAILGIAKSTAYRLVNSGEFKTIRIGYAIRISRKSLLDCKILLLSKSSLSKLLIVTIVDSKSILITIAPNIFWLIISIEQNALESN